MLSYTPTKQEGNPDGYTPIQCYVLMDSHGDRSGPYPCKDYDTLDRVIRGKENVNLQIKMWVEGVLEGTTFIEEIKDCTKEYPEWVFKSFINQLSRENFKKHGWIPTFIRKHISP